MSGQLRGGGRTPAHRTAAQRGQSQIWLVWGLIAAVVVVAGLIGIGVFIGVKRHQETQQELKALRETGNQLIEQQRQLADGKASGSPLAPPPQAGETVPAHNETEMLRGFNAILREVGGRSHQLQGQIAAEVKTLKLEDVLTPQRLASAEGRRTSRETLRRYRELIERSAAGAEQARTEMRRRLDILVSQLPNRERLQAKFESSSAKRGDLEQQMIRNQREVADLIVQAIDLIEQARKRVQLQGDQLAFTSQRDLDRYNDVIVRIQAAGREEERLSRLEQDLLRQAQTQFDQAGRE